MAVLEMLALKYFSLNISTTPITGSGIATGIGGGVWFSSGQRRPVRHGMLACGMVAYSKAARPALLVNVGTRDRPPWFPHLHTRASSRMVQSNRKKNHANLTRMEQDRPSFSGSELAFFFDEEDIAATAEEDIVQPPHRGRRHLEVDVFFAFLSLGKKRSGPKFTKRQKN